MFGIILMVSVIFLGAPVLLSLFEAMLVGLSIGIVLSQMIPDNPQNTHINPKNAFEKGIPVESSLSRLFTSCPYQS